MPRGRDMAHARARVVPSVSLDVTRGLMELRSLYEHLQARILEMI